MLKKQLPLSFLKKLLLCLPFFIHNAFASTPIVPKDPYEQIRYSKAFDQKNIHKKHRNLLERLNCAQNVFQTETDMLDDQEAGSATHSSPDYSPIDDLDRPVTHTELQQYYEECLTQLDNARWWALAQPGQYAVIEMTAMAGGAALAMKTLGSESMGGSFAGFAAIFDSLRLLRGTIQSGCNISTRQFTRRS